MDRGASGDQRPPVLLRASGFAHVGYPPVNDPPAVDRALGGGGSGVRMVDVEDSNPGPVLPKCGNCGSDPIQIMFAVVETPLGGMAVAFCSRCRSSFGCLPLAINQPPARERSMVMVPQ